MYNPEKPYTNKILELIDTCSSNNWCMKIGHALHMYYNYPTIDHTDGIGTKGHLHWKYKTFKSAVIDAFAMNVNDLAMLGAIPFKLQNHLFLPDESYITEIMTELVTICKEYDIVITGGETSIHDNMNGMDISITMSGIAEKERLNQYQIGDTLIGIPSSGLHSNGFTLVRKLIDSLELTTPTRIYLKEVNKVRDRVNGINHITGGAYTKLYPNLPKNADLVFDFKNKPQKVFMDLYECGVSSDRMYRTFNCGYGMILGVSSENVDRVLEEVGGDIVGKVVTGNRNIRVKSVFDREWYLIK